MPEWLLTALQLAAPVFAAGGAYIGVKVKLDWHKAEIDRAHRRLDAHDEFFMDELRRTGL